MDLNTLKQILLAQKRRQAPMVPAPMEPAPQLSPEALKSLQEVHGLNEDLQNREAASAQGKAFPASETGYPEDLVVNGPPQPAPQDNDLEAKRKALAMLANK